jgi:hypothetical protein
VVVNSRASERSSEVVNVSGGAGTRTRRSAAQRGIRAGNEVRVRSLRACQKREKVTGR